MATSIVIDAGHGGFDSGASYQGRREKDEVLQLALAVGEKLKQDGFDVYFTRTTDEYASPIEKARIANETGADFFVSLHRNSSPLPNTYNGVQTLVYQENPVVNDIAASINRQLEAVGFQNLGIEERPGLVVLRRTDMPAVLVEVGFINSDIDNQIFDQNFDAIVNGIAVGIEEGIREAQGETARRYGVQTGLFQFYSNAQFMQQRFQDLGYTVQVRREGPYYAVIVGEEPTLEMAAALQSQLREMGNDTLIVTL